MKATRSTVIAIAAAASLVLAACGDDTSEPSADGLQAPVPVRAVGSGGGTATAESDSARVAGDALVDPAIGMPYFAGFEYQAGDGLPALPTNSTGYQYVPDATVDAAVVADLAAVLGAEDEPVAGGGRTGDGTLWRVGPDDGSGPSLWVGADAQLSWYYSPAWDAAVTDVACAETVDASGAVVRSDCPEPEPPAGILTAEQAEERVTALLASMGEDPAAFELETYADQWYASVTAWQRFDGLRAPVAFGFGFGENGELQYANGVLADPVATGPYPLIDLDQALARLTEQGGFWGGVASPMADAARAAEATAAGGAADPAQPDAGAGTSGADPVVASVPPATVAPTDTVAPEVPVTTEPGTVTPSDTVPAEPVTSAPVTSEPAVVEPQEPVREVAVLIDVRADLWSVWDDDGSVWLLPAYTFTDTEDRTHTVPAVSDEYLIVVETPPAPEPLPVEPVPGTEPATEPGVEPGSDPAEPAPADAAMMQDAVGTSLDEFAKVAEGYGWSVRVIREDGEDLAATMDFVPTRLNVATEGGIVTEIISVG